MKRTVLACICGILTGSAWAQSLPVTPDAVFTFNGEEITISRSATLPQDSFDVVSRAFSDCPAPCLSPMTVAPGVATFGELDVITFLSNDVDGGTGLLVDARLPEDRHTAFIPASVNIPSATVTPENPYRDDILQALGAAKFQNLISFDNAKTLVVFDDGPATQDAQIFILDMIAAGYPAEKINYYRGGMQMWTTLGLTTRREAE